MLFAILLSVLMTPRIVEGLKQTHFFSVFRRLLRNFFKKPITFLAFSSLIRTFAAPI